jgi:hypothetical protein
MSLTAWVVVIAATGGLVLAAWLSNRRDATENVVVARHPIPADSPLGPTDLALRAVKRADVPSGALRSLDAASGHYALHHRTAGDVLVHNDLGPAADPAAAAVVPVHVDDDRKPEIHKGERVDLLLAPSIAHAPTVVVPRALIVDTRELSDGATLVYLAVPATAEAKIASVSARGKATLARASH